MSLGVCGKPVLVRCLVNMRCVADVPYVWRSIRQLEEHLSRTSAQAATAAAQAPLPATGAPQHGLHVSHGLPHVAVASCAQGKTAQS